MDLTVQLQRLYDRIELVSGAGDRRYSRLCAMSLVAYLTGERHGDRPTSASTLVREFTMILNDRMDAQQRQQLKPFAPRIIGTQDGREAERALLLYHCMVRDVFPEVLADLGPLRWDPALAQAVERLQRLSRAILRESPGLFAALPPAHRDRIRPIDAARLNAMRSIVRSFRRRKYPEMTKSAARLLAVSADHAPTAKRSAWYWCKALELLDRLCDVGAAERAATGLVGERLLCADQFLGDAGDSSAAGGGELRRRRGTASLLSHIVPWLSK